MGNGARRSGRFNRAYILKTFQVGERVLEKTNPVGSMIQNKAAKFYRLYTYVFQRQIADHALLVTDPADHDKFIDNYHVASLRKLYE